MRDDNLQTFNLRILQLYLRESAFLVHESETVQRFLRQSVHNFLIINKIHRTPVQTFAAVLRLNHKQKTGKTAQEYGHRNTSINKCSGHILISLSPKKQKLSNFLY